MRNFYTGLHAYFNALIGGIHNSFWIAINGRLFNGDAPDGTDYPYAVHSLISDVPDYNWDGALEDVLLQFDIWSIASSPGEIEDAATYCKALFDNCYFIVTTPMISMDRINSFRTIDEITTPEGTSKAWHYIIEYRILIDP